MGLQDRSVETAFSCSKYAMNASRVSSERVSPMLGTVRGFALSLPRGLRMASRC